MIRHGSMAAPSGWKATTLWMDLTAGVSSFDRTVTEQMLDPRIDLAADRFRRPYASCLPTYFLQFEANVSPSQILNSVQRH